MTYAVEFEVDGPAKELAEIDDCIALARRLHESARLDRPLGALFHRPDGESLSVAIGAEVSFMVWFPANYAETALGSLSSEANIVLDAPVDYWLCGHHGQIGPVNAVAIPTMFSALEQFLRDGGPPKVVGWVPD